MRAGALAPILPDIHILNAQGNRELILVVDDETEISEFASGILADGGYKVVLAKDGFEALRIYQQIGPQIGLVVLDFFLPVMDGDAVFDELRTLNPNVDVVLNSGLAEQRRLVNARARTSRIYPEALYAREAARAGALDSRRSVARKRTKVDVQRTSKCARVSGEIGIASDAYERSLCIVMRASFRLPFLFSAVTALLLPCASASALPNTTRLLRFPAINGPQIVFAFAGELYTVGRDGGVARRLTSGPGYSSFPRFSTDGTQLAFTSQYDGNTEVYVMPADGGVPKRLTTTATLGRDDVSDRMGPNNIVMAWQNTKPQVAFRSRMTSYNSFNGSLYTVGLDAELPRQLPVPRGGFLSFSPDDSKMAFNRIFREFRTWKHYRGGMADDIWIFNFDTGTTQNLTNDAAQDICPMRGPDDRIYFISDRDGRMNLFSTDLAGKETKQLTKFTDFDIKFPSLGKDAIVFEQAGYIWRYDLGSGQATVVPIDIREDFASGRGALVDASKNMQSVNAAPDGERVIAVARGDLFSVPAKDGSPRNLSRSSNAHERDAVWSPDGKWVAYDSDVPARTSCISGCRTEKAMQCK